MKRNFARFVRGVKRLLRKPLSFLRRLVRRIKRAAQRVREEPDRKRQMDQAVEFLTQFATEAARRAGVRTRDIQRFFRKNQAAVVDGAKLLAGKEIHPTGAYLIARGVRNERLRNAIVQMYRPKAEVGDGSTAAKLIDEARKGQRLDHLPKAIGFRRTLVGSKRRPGRGILSGENLTAAEREVAAELVRDLNRAIAIARRR